MIEIDGSQGEGGGQIVRSSLALSILTGTPIVLHNIRAKRKNAGLAKQHLMAVIAATAISGAEMRGAAVGSSRLDFAPGPVQPGSYRFPIGTAGSASLVLQTILPPLLLASGPSSLVIEGGTHNPLAPPAEFLQHVYAPLIRRLGPGLVVELKRHGFYPGGGGRLEVQVEPAQQLSGLTLLERGTLQRKGVRAIVANLPKSIAERECQEFRRLSEWPKPAFRAEEVEAHGCGNAVLAELQFEHVTEFCAGFGERGVRAEQVAANVWQETAAYLAHEAPVGPHLADQLLLPLAIATSQGNESTFRTMELTGHSLTHIDIVQRFLPVRIDIEPQASGVVDLRLARSI